MLASLIRSKIERLALSIDRQCLSVYMPVATGKQESRQNPIRLKNLLETAFGRLLEHGVVWRDARQMIYAVLQTTGEPEQWPGGSRGLAIFASPTQTDLVWLPQPVDELCVVGPRYEITPLLTFETDETFLVLAISANHCRMLRGDRWTLQPVAVPDLPRCEQDSLPPPDHQHTIAAHGGVRQGAARNIVFTGQGDGCEHTKDELLAYFRDVDRAICHYLAVGKEPLVLAAVAHLAPLYREANHYKNLQAQVIAGNPDLRNVYELHRRAWEIVTPRILVREQRELQWRADQLRAGVCRGLHEIVVAAGEGRVAKLRVAPGKPHWGQFEPALGECRRLDSADPRAEDLVNVAAVETLRHGGKVFAADLALAGIHEPVAALLKARAHVIEARPIHADGFQAGAAR